MTGDRQPRRQQGQGSDSQGEEGPDTEQEDQSDGGSDDGRSTASPSAGSWDHLHQKHTSRRKNTSLRESYDRQREQHDQAERRMKKLSNALEEGPLKGTVDVQQWMQFETMKNLLALQQRTASREETTYFESSDFRPGLTKVSRGIEGYRRYRDSISKDSIRSLEGFEQSME